ncbi:hypothetical protein A2U01_0103765, partial [Trifolium medium]|nr:hypothetical protein [Trifolium medium]
MVYGAKQGEIELRRVRVKKKKFAANMVFWNLRAAQG